EVCDVLDKPIAIAPAHPPQIVGVEQCPENVFDAIESAPEPIVCAPGAFEEATEVAKLHAGELFVRGVSRVAERVPDASAHEEESEWEGDAWVLDREGVAYDL